MSSGWAQKGIERIGRWLLIVVGLAVTGCASVPPPTMAVLASPTPSTTPTLTATPTIVPSTTPTATATPTQTAAPTQTPTASPTPAPTMTQPPTPSATKGRRYWMRYEIEHPTVLAQQTLVDRLWLPLPNTDGDGTRDLELIEVYPAGGQVLNIGQSNQAVYWDNVPAMCQQTDCRFGAEFHITLDLPTYTIPWTSPVAYSPESELYQTYTSPQRGIQSEDPDLRQLANDIVGDETNPYKQVLLLQSWIQQNVRYPDLGSSYPDDALLCLADRVGDCAGQSKVFVALCRALGIPARTVSGLRPYEAGVGRLEVFAPRAAWFERTLDVHVWGEVYFPQLGWVQCEPDMPGFGVDKERLITKRGPFAFSGGVCQQATYFHLPLAVQGNWCGQSIGWEVSIDARPLDE